MMASSDLVFITRKWAPAMGGMETYCQRLTDELAAQGSVEVIALPGRADGMPPSALALLFFPFTVLRRLLGRRSRARIVHLGDMAIWPLALLCRLLAPGCVVVLSAHGTDASFPRRRGLLGRIYGAYLRTGARLLRHSHVIANSRATRDVLAESGWYSANVIPLATDVTIIAGPSAGNGRLLFAGRLIPLKGCGWFIREVLPLLPETVELDVAGTCWDANEEAALDHPRVTYLGQLAAAELSTAYSAASCVIAPNIATPNRTLEGFGLVAVEAAAAGGLVLAADHGGLRDAVIDGKTGHLVAPGDAQAWADAVMRSLALPTGERMAFLENASRLAREHFCWSRVARDTRAVYDAALAG